LTLTLDPFAQVTVGSFSFSRSAASTTAADGTTALNGTLFAVTLNGLTLHVGVSGAQLDITAGSLAAYSFQVGASNYLYVTGQGFGLQAAIGPLAASAANVGFLYTAGPAAPAAQLRNWAFATGGAATDLAAGLIQVSGSTLTLTLDPFAAVTVGSFSFSRSAASTTAADGTTALNGTL